MKEIVPLYEKIPEDQIMVKKLSDDEIAVSAYSRDGYRDWVKVDLSKLTR